jgi:hypothetical protein
MANVFVEGINFMRDDEEKDPPIGTLKGRQSVGFPREENDDGTKALYEARKSGACS